MNEFSNIVSTIESKFRGKHSIEDEVNKFKSINAFLQSQLPPRDLFSDEEFEPEEEFTQRKSVSPSDFSSSFQEVQDPAQNTRNRNSLILKDIDSFRNNSMAPSQRIVAPEQKKRFSLRTDFDSIYAKDSSDEEDVSDYKMMPAIPEEFTVAPNKKRAEIEPNAKGEFLFLIFSTPENKAKRRSSTLFDTSKLAMCNLTDLPLKKNRESGSVFVKGSLSGVEGNPFFLLSATSHEGNTIMLDKHDRPFIQEGEISFKEKSVSALVGISGNDGGVFIAHPGSQTAFNYFRLQNNFRVGFTKKAPKFFHPYFHLEAQNGKLYLTDTNSVKGTFVTVPHKEAFVAEPQTLLKVSKNAFIGFEFIKSSTEIHFKDQIICVNGEEPEELIKSFLTESPLAHSHKAKRSLFQEKGKFLDECLAKFPTLKVNLVRFDSISRRFVQRRAVILYFNTRNFSQGEEKSSNTKTVFGLEDSLPFKFLNSFNLKVKIGFHYTRKFWFFYSNVRKNIRTSQGFENQLKTEKIFNEFRFLSSSFFSEKVRNNSISRQINNPAMINSLNWSNCPLPKPISSMHELQDTLSYSFRKPSLQVAVGEFNLLQETFSQRKIEIGLESEIEIDGNCLKISFSTLNKFSN